jgi:hypothetical protein
MFGIKLMMSISNFATSFIPAYHSALKIIKKGFWALKSDPAIVIYPLLLLLALISTLTTISAWIYSAANAISHEAAFQSQQSVFVIGFDILAILLSTIYGYMLLSFFSSLIAASVIGHLEGKSAPLIYGIKLTSKHFRRIMHFAFLSLILIPLGILSQRHKWKEPRPAVEVLGSSLSLNIAGLSPAIISGTEGVEETIIKTIVTMGKAWRENLIIKAGIYLILIIIAVSISLSTNGLLSLLLGMAFFIVAKVFTSVFTATIYWHAATSHGQKRLIKD